MVKKTLSLSAKTLSPRSLSEPTNLAQLGLQKNMGCKKNTGNKKTKRKKIHATGVAKNQEQKNVCKRTCESCNTACVLRLQGKLRVLQGMLRTCQIHPQIPTFLHWLPQVAQKINQAKKYHLCY